jgi:hypothetical protein
LVCEKESTWSKLCHTPSIDMSYLKETTKTGLSPGLFSRMGRTHRERVQREEA